MADPDLSTFLFADLAGFTALTEAHGDERAADLVGDFCAQTRGLLGDYEAEEIKGIGDALMLRIPNADAGVQLALRMARDIGGQHGFPSVRVGMHTGPAVERDGDWFGATVNLASRVCGAAAAGEVLVTWQTIDATSGEFHFQARGRRRLKNVRDAVEVFSVAGPGEALAVRLAIDPVCRMAVDPTRTPHRTTYAGTEYLFCSPACAAAFAEAPSTFHHRRSSRSELLVSERGRDWATGLLGRAYKRGRISIEELEERVDHAYLARTRGEITAVVGDLPEYRRARLWRRRRLFWERFFPGLGWLRRRRENRRALGPGR